MSHCFYLTCTNLKPGNISHKIKDFDTIYEITDDKVRRKNDSALVIVLGFYPLENRFDPDLICSCLTGNMEEYRDLPIASVEHILPNSYYRISCDPMHGDESLGPQDWLRS